MTKQRLLDAVLAAPWLMQAEALRTVIEVASRGVVDEGAVAAWKAAPQAVAARRGDRLEGTRAVTVRNGVAVVPLVGPIFRYANMFAYISGGTSLDSISRDFHAALNERSIEAIVLDINSPGGESTGIEEFAAMVRDASAVKPVTAYVEGSGASAAYWIASAAPDVAMGRTAMVGSIGAVLAIDDRREADARSGRREIKFVSSVSPRKHAEPDSEDGQAEYQSWVDGLGEEFVAAVSRYRGVSEETVLSDFGQGGLLMGAQAVAAGMADRLASFEEVLAGLVAGRGTVAAGGGQRSTNTKGYVMATEKARPAATEPDKAAASEPMTAERLRVEHPAVAEALVAEGRAAGVSAERARILGIEAQALPGHEKLVAELKADGTTSPTEAAVKIVAAEKALAANRLAGQRAAEAITGTVPVAAAPAVEAPVKSAIDQANDTTLDLDKRVAAAWQDPQVRAEFKQESTVRGYLAAGCRL